MKKMMQILKSMFPYLSRHRATFMSVICFTFIGKFTELIQPFLVGNIIDHVTKGDFTGIDILIISICIVGVTSSFLTYFSTFQLTKMSIEVSADLKTDFYNDMIMLGMEKFDKIQSGKFLSRYETDINSVAEFLSSHFVNFVMNFFSTLIIIYFSFSISVVMTFIVLLFLPISLVIEYFFSTKIKKIIQIIRGKNEKYLTLFNETINGIVEIKHLQRECLFKEKMANHQKSFMKDLVGLSATRNIGNFSKKTVFIALEFLIFIVGVHYIKSNGLSIGVFIAFSNYAAHLNNTMSTTIRTLGYFNEVSVSINRIQEVRKSMITHENENKSVLEREDMFKESDIYFRDVDFAYDEKRMVFKKLNLTLDHINSNVIVGDSGLGKSTLFKILLKLYPVKRGDVIIGNLSISDISANEIRKNIAYIPHNPYFFNVSIKENILYANPNIKDNEIIDILNKVNLYEYISLLPNGINTIIQESGKNFSEGQKQRLNIARAIAKKPSIFLFDEPTSALDLENRNDILKIIDEINKDSTVVIITHDRDIAEQLSQSILIELNKRAYFEEGIEYE